MARLDESSQLNILQNSLADIVLDNDNTKGQELITGIDAREKLLETKQQQFKE